MPGLADWCVIDLPGPRGRLDPVAIAHVVPAMVEPARELHRRCPATGEQALARVVATGESLLRSEIDDTELGGASDGVRAGSAMAVPLMAARRTIGAMTFVAARPGRFDEADLDLAQELGRRAGTALENARLYEERSELARTLATSLRPPALPRMPGWSAAALYQPAGRTDEVGGDFYDVVSVGDAWMVVIGDVIGKGPAAAALTGLARYSIRTAATLTASPAAALKHLNDNLHREEQSGIISAVCVLLRERDGRAEATIACAGHPPPVLVNRGDPRSVGTPSLLLGVTADAGFAEKTVVLDDDDTLVLYTDGVLDAEGRGERFGERRLLDALRGQTSSAEEALRRVVAPLELFQEGPQRDDIAMLVVRRARESASDADAPPGVVIPLARRARG